MGWFIAGMVVGGSIIGLGVGAVCAGKIADLEARIAAGNFKRAQDHYRNSVR